MVDEVFIGCGRNLGLEIWRIENMQVVPVDRQTYGKFHTGDSYIVLSTRRKKFRYEWNIHFWLGSETSQDEAVVAAYKTMELDDSLGGAPTQHREVQNHESKLFISYFPKGLQYLAGGIESGLRKVDRDAYEPRLLHVKGHRNIRVQETLLTWTSMNSGDVFIFDEGLTIWVWNGKEAGRMEKVKGLDVARRIRDEERGGRAKLEIVEEETMVTEAREFIQNMNAVVVDGITVVMDGTPIDFQPATDDDTFERQSRELVKLYRVSDASGEMEVIEVGSFPLKMELLDTNDAFILDTASGSIFVWLGRGSTKDEKKAAFKNGVEFIEAKGYPSWTNVTCVNEDAETPLFKQNFTNWLNKAEIQGPQAPRAYKPGPSEKFDVTAMQQGGQRKAKPMVDDGTGTVQIWRIENFEPQPVDPDLYGQFYAGDCYIILYAYLHNIERYIIYFWLGQESTRDEQAAAALHTVALDNQYGGAPVQVRVIQNKEPDHFLLIFKGKMVVHSGGIASGFQNRTDGDSYDVDGTRLFHVRGTNSINCRAVQVEEKASSLNSNDCFILESPGATYIWYGKGCSEDERQLADMIATSVIRREPERVMEESEPSTFWEALGGYMEYASAKWLAEVLPTNPPRLFQCSNATGNIRIEEIFNFAQEDLVPEDVMILDTYNDVFIWVGRGANEVEKKQSLTIATEYIQSDPPGRDLQSTSILQVKQGFEPVTFTCNFLAWNPDFWSQEQSYEEYKMSVQTGVVSASQELLKYDNARKLTYQELLGSPEGIDVTKKEMYLTEEDFKAVMGITVHEYKALPAWKQNNMKKTVGLF